MPPPVLLTATTRAIDHFHKLLNDRGKQSLGIRLGVKTKGCSGLSYTLEYVDCPVEMDERVELDEGVVLFVEPKAVMFVLGTEIDFVIDQLEEGFVFRNPNEKGRCGCGESFHV